MSESAGHVLGSVLIEPDRLLEITDVLRAEDFAASRDRAIFNAMLDLYDNGEPLELHTLYRRLEVKGESIGVDYLNQLLNDTPTAANCMYHAKKVKAAATIRRIRRLGLDVAGRAHEGIMEAPELLAHIEAKLSGLAESVAEKKSPAINDICGGLLKTFQPEVERKGIETNLFLDSRLDRAIPRHYPGHVWVLAGYTSVGKSTMLAQVIVDAAEQGARIVVFSTEDSREEKAIKLIANLSGVSQRRLLEGQVEHREQDVRDAVTRIREWPITIYDDVFSVAEMRLKVKKRKLRGGVDIVAVDYIQGLHTGGSIYESMSAAASGLYRLAKEMQVNVIECSQVNNESMREEANVIGVKGAGEIAAVADIVLWLRRIKGSETALDCEIRKNRPYGQTGAVPLQFAGNWTRIERRAV